MMWILTALGLGGAGLYLAMPGRGALLARLGLLLLVSGVAVLIACLAPLAAGAPTQGWFLSLVTVAVAAAIGVVINEKPVYSALYFVLVILAITGLLVLMQAEFLGAVVLIIYAGAILVTYLFVIMLAQQSGVSPTDSRPRGPLLGTATGIILLGALAPLLFAPAGSLPATISEPLTTSGTTFAVGLRLITDYGVALQIAGVLLLAAMIGAVAIAQRTAMDSTEVEDA